MFNRNERFKAVLDWLYENGKVADQRELSEVTGITETTISRIRNGKVRQPSEDTLRKLNSAFGNIFNMQFFRGESDDMLADHHANTKEQTAELSIIELAATLIKENEALRRQLTATIAEVRTLRDEMNQDRDTFRAIRATLSSMLYHTTTTEPIPMAADKKEEFY